MSLSKFEIKRAEKIVSTFIERIRPPQRIREQLDYGYRIENQSVEIFGVRPVWNNSSKQIEEKVARTTYVKKDKVWKIYWMRADLKWHRYEPYPTANNLEEFLGVVEKDAHGCFFG